MSSYVWAWSPPSIVSHGTTECYIQSFPVQLKLFHVFWYLMDFFPEKKKPLYCVKKTSIIWHNSKCSIKKMLNHFLIFMFFYFSFNLIFFCWEWSIGTKKTFTWVYFLFSGEKIFFLHLRTPWRIGNFVIFGFFLSHSRCYIENFWSWKCF